MAIPVQPTLSLSNVAGGVRCTIGHASAQHVRRFAIERAPVGSNVWQRIGYKPISSGRADAFIDLCLSDTTILYDWANGKPVVIGETGLPHNKGDVPQWATLWDAVIGFCEAQGVAFCGWQFGERASSTDPLQLIDTSHIATDPIVDRGTVAPLLAIPRVGSSWSDSYYRLRGIAATGGEGNSGGSGYSNRNIGEHGSGSLLYWFNGANGLHTLQAMKDKGFSYIRIPFAWERVISDFSGDTAIVRTAELQRLIDCVKWCGQIGLKAVPDMHSYGRYCYQAEGSSTITAYRLGRPLTNGGSVFLTYAKFADTWRKIIQAFQADSTAYNNVLAWEIMNEPVNMGSYGTGSVAWPDTQGAQRWETASQQCVDAIRALGDTKPIWMATYFWSNVMHVNRFHPNGPWITDSANAVWYVGHDYYAKKYQTSQSIHNYGATYAEEVTDAQAKGYSAKAAATSFTFDDTTTQPGSSYQYRIVAANYEGESTPSATQQITASGGSAGGGGELLSATFLPEADTYNSVGSPSSNFGTDPVFWIGGSNGLYSLMRFNVSGLAANAVITGVELRLTVNNRSVDAGGGGTLHLHMPPSATWNETTPTHGTWTGTDDGPSLGTRDAATTGVQVVWTNLQGVVSSNGQITFSLRSSAADGAAYYARNHTVDAEKPQLVVTYSVPLTVDKTFGLGGQLQAAPSGATADLPLVVAGRIDARGYQARILSESGLLSYWRLGESVGATTAVDRAAGFDGTYMGGPTLGAPSLLASSDNAAVSFDGVDDYVTIPDDDRWSWHSAGAGSLEAWFKLDTLPASRAVIVGKTQSGGHEWVLYITSAGKVVVEVYGTSGAGRIIVTSAATITVGQRYHVVAVIAASSPYGRIYLNGVQDAQTTAINTTAPINSATPVTIGRRNSGDQYFDGIIDEVAIYNVALSATTIADLWTLGSSGTNNTYLNIGAQIKAQRDVPMALGGSLILRQDRPLAIGGRAVYQSNVPMALGAWLAAQHDRDIVFSGVLQAERMIQIEVGSVVGQQWERVLELGAQLIRLPQVNVPVGGLLQQLIDRAWSVRGVLAQEHTRQMLIGGAIQTRGAGGGVGLYDARAAIGARLVQQGSAAIPIAASVARQASYVTALGGLLHAQAERPLVIGGRLGETLNRELVVGGALRGTNDQPLAVSALLLPPLAPPVVLIPRPNPLYLGGVPLYTVENSLVVSYGGGSAATRTASQRTIGTRNDARATAISAKLYPYGNDTLADMERVLGIPGIVPIVLPDGRRFAVQSDEHEIEGYHEQGSDSYTASWRVRHDVSMADLFLRGNRPGAYAAIPTPDTPYTLAGSWAMLPEDGVQLTGSGRWNRTYLAERSGTTATPVLVAELTIAENTDAALGLVDLAEQRTIQPLGARGIGVRFTPQALQVLEQNNGLRDGVGMASTAGRYTVIITARPFGSRVEIWNGVNRLIYNVSLAYRMGGAGALLHVRSGAATLHRWYVVRR
jgi:hypothetical protein